MLDKIKKRAQSQQDMLRGFAQEASKSVAARAQSLGVRAQSAQQKGEVAIGRALKQLDSIQGSFIEDADSMLASVAPKVAQDLPFLGESVTGAIEKTRSALQFVDQQYKSFSSSAVSLMGVLPIAGYDSLTANQVVQTLKGLSAEEIHTVRHYEANHKNRTSVLRACDTQLRKHA